MSVLAVALGRELGMLEKELEDLGVAAMLHDVGKIKIPVQILDKEGELSDEEYDLMKTHAYEGKKLLMSKHDLPHSTVDVAYSHHEKMNGKGYPRGLAGDNIPYFAKIVAIADAFDAITSERCYSKARSTLEALRIIYACRGDHFDPDLVKSFVRMIGIYPPGHIVELSSGEAGIVLSCESDNKLKPKILVVRGTDKKLCKEKVIDLRDNLKDAQNQPIRVKRVFNSGKFGIDLQEYKNKGLNFQANAS